MSPLALALVVLALLAPYAPLALDYGQRAVQARRHAACLQRIAALERELGMRGGDMVENFYAAIHAARWAEPPRERPTLPRPRPRRTWAQWATTYAAHSSPELSKAQEEQWEANRKRLVAAARARYGHGRRL